METPAHDQEITHRYRLHYPAHEPREEDPHYALFLAWRRTHREGAVCEVGARGPAFAGDCKGNLELHHRVIEFALINAVDLTTFIKDHPDVHNEEELQHWAESADEQFEWLCAFHHRGHAGVHVASASDWANEAYIPGLIS